jgi:hypothetical protein
MKLLYRYFHGETKKSKNNVARPIRFQTKHLEWRPPNYTSALKATQLRICYWLLSKRDSVWIAISLCFFSSFFSKNELLSAAATLHFLIVCWVKTIEFHQQWQCNSVFGSYVFRIFTECPDEFLWHLSFTLANSWVVHSKSPQNIFQATSDVMPHYFRNRYSDAK